MQSVAIVHFTVSIFVPVNQLASCLLTCKIWVQESQEPFMWIFLQMNHLRFYQACKNQGAVKEAIRYTRLLQSSSTLQIYNMLLSVCRHARDTDGMYVCVPDGLWEFLSLWISFHASPPALTLSFSLMINCFIFWSAFCASSLIFPVIFATDDDISETQK